MNRSSALTIAAVIVLVGMAAIPMAASAATDPAIDLEQDPGTGDAIVTVTDNGTTVGSASVTVIVAFVSLHSLDRTTPCDRTSN